MKREAGGREANTDENRGRRAVNTEVNRDRRSDMKTRKKTPVTLRKAEWKR